MTKSRSKSKPTNRPRPRPFFTDLGRQLQRQRDLIGSLTAKWIPVLGLDSWQVDSLYCLQPDPGMHPESAAEVTVRWKYKTVTVRWVLPKVSHESAADLEYMVVHELCHALVNEMRDSRDFDDRAMEHEERVVTELARAFLRAGKLAGGKRRT